MFAKVHVNFASALASCGLALTIVGFSAPAWAADPGRFSIGLEPSYFSGRYGARHLIHIYVVPLSFIYRSNRLRLRVQIPYVAITGGSILGSGSVIAGSGRSNFRSGVGDVLVEGEYRLGRADGFLPSVKPYAKVKIPVTSIRWGLSTGQPDAEFGGRFAWRIQDRLFPYIQLGYRVVGGVRGLNLRNVTTHEAGLTFAVARHQFLTAVLIGHTALLRGGKPVESLVAAYDLRINDRWSVEAFAEHGLTPSSASVGGGVGLTAHF